MLSSGSVTEDSETILRKNLLRGAFLVIINQ